MMFFLCTYNYVLQSHPDFDQKCTHFTFKIFSYFQNTKKTGCLEKPQNDTESHRMTQNFFWHNFQYSVVFTNHRIFCILWFLPIICHRISCILISLISLITWNGSTFLFTNQIGSNLVQSLLTTVPSFPSNFWNFQFKGQILEYYFSRR